MVSTRGRLGSEMITRQDFLYFIKSKHVVTDVAKMSEVVNTLSVYKSGELCDIVEPTIKSRVLEFPNISSCEVIFKNSRSVYDASAIEQTTQITRNCYETLPATEDNIKRVIKNYSVLSGNVGAVVKVHVKLPEIKTLLTALMNTVIVTTRFTSLSCCGDIMLYAPDRFIDKGIHNEYSVNFRISKTHYLSPSTMKREIKKYLICHMGYALDNTDILQRLSNHLKMYGRVEPLTMYVIGENYLKDYIDKNLYDDVFTLDDKLSK